MRDVDRTFQKIQFFQEENTKEALADVLLIWSVLNPETSYRQGMNELMAIIYLVVFAEQADPNMDECLYTLNDPSMVEADTYILFDRVMKLGLIDLFLQSEDTKSLSKLFTMENPIRARYTQEDLDKSKILQKCHRIFHVYLKNIDVDLYDYLTNRNVEPHLFLL